MSAHSLSRLSRTPRSEVGFLRAWTALLGAVPVPPIPRRVGRPPRVPVADLLAALTYHVAQGAGTLADHFTELFGTDLADSSWSDRRQRLPWDIFADLMARVLRPRATRAHADAFWRGWRLLALDGTQFSLINTAQVHARQSKARSRRGDAAFAKLTAVVLLELGLRNPIAAAVGHVGESEWALGRQVLSRIPPHALVLGDRLYGCTAFAREALATCHRVGSHFVLRVRMHIRPTEIERLPDGSRLVRVPVRDPRLTRHILDWFTVREIRVRVGRPGHRTTELRLWTSVLDPTQAPAPEVAALYARRWEHELYFREVKRTLRHTDLLQSHTVETGAQEIAAIVLASALLAVERLTIAGDDLPPLRVRFAKLHQVVQALWLTLALGDGVLTEAQRRTMFKRGQERMRQCLVPERRSRSCPRKVRQPLRGWPRLLHNESVEGPFHLDIL